MVPTAAVAGFFAGLFGIGGGLITVPFLFFIFDYLNIDKTYLMHLSVGTSFSLCIMTTPHTSKFFRRCSCTNKCRECVPVNKITFIVKDHYRLKF